MDMQSNPVDDDGGGYLIAVSDMMAALLFVFLITLVAFVINFQMATEQQQEALDDLTNARELRSEMLEDIRARLQERGIRVEIDSEYGILRLTENAISFDSAQATLAQREQEKLSQVAAVLADVVPCYAADAPPRCDARTQGKLDAVFVEGHTDNVPLTPGRFQDNWDLSAQRAMSTYRAISQDQPKLMSLQNQLRQPLFSVSGYGAGRPVVDHEKPTAEPSNRRIDLRFIMTPPTAAQDPEPVRALRDRGVR